MSDEKITIEVDTTFASALDEVSRLLTHGHGNVSPESAARISEVAEQVRSMAQPPAEVARVVFTREGGLFNIHHDRSWDDYRSLRPEEAGAMPGRAMQVGATTILLTPDGQSVMTVHRDTETASSVMDDYVEAYEAWLAENSQSA